jgi:hypothetical protein
LFSELGPPPRLRNFWKKPPARLEVAVEQCRQINGAPNCWEVGSRHETLFLFRRFRWHVQVERASIALDGPTSDVNGSVSLEAVAHHPDEASMTWKHSTMTASILVKRSFQIAFGSIALHSLQSGDFGLQPRRAARLRSCLSAFVSKERGNISCKG